MRFYLGFLSLIFAFSTNAQTVASSEDFQSGIPATWTIVDEDGNTPNAQVSEYTEAWISKEDPDSTGNFTASATSYFEPTGQADRWLITPALALSSYGNIIYWKGKSHDASFPESYEIRISTTTTEVDSFTKVLDVVFAESELWADHSLNLSDSGYNDQTVFIAFRLITSDGFKMYFDDFEQIIDDPVGVPETAVSPLSIVTTGKNKFQISNNLNTPETRIFDVQGRELMDLDPNPNSLKIEHKGLVFILVRDGEAILRKKFWLD